MARLAVVLATLLLSACATSPGAMEHPDNASTFTVDEPYQLVLKRIVEAEQNCRTAQVVPIGQQINDVQHYPDLREAKIIQGASGIGRQIHHVVHVREAGEGTEVVVYTKAYREKKLDAVKRWAAGDSACP